MTGLFWLASLLLVGLSGLPLLFHRAFAGYPLSTRLVLAGASGAALVSFAMTAAVLLGIPWNLPGLLAAGAALAAGLRLFLKPPFAVVLPRPEEPGETPRVLAAAVLSVIAVGAALGGTFAGAATSPDLLFFWGPKAQQFALARTFDAAFIRDELHQHMHAYYPPLVTNIGAFASMAAGRMSWTGATLTFPLLLALLAAGLPGALADRLGRAHAAAIAALTVAAICCLGVEADIAGNGEMPLLLFETLAIALLLSEAAAEPPTQLLAGILLAGAAATKVEGLPFTMSAAALFFLARPRASRPFWPAAGRLLLPAVVMLAAWFAFGASRRIFFGYSGYGTLFDLHLDHFRVVLAAVGRSLLATGHALPWLVPLGCVLAALPLTHRWMLPIGTAAILTAFFLFTYIHRAEDPSLWISWSAARIFSPVAMLFALAASLGSRGERRAVSS